MDNEITPNDYNKNKANNFDKEDWEYALSMNPTTPNNKDNKMFALKDRMGFVGYLIIFVLLAIAVGMFYVLVVACMDYTQANKAENIFKSNIALSVKKEEANLAKTDPVAINPNNPNNFYLQANGKTMYYLNNPQTILMDVNYPFSTTVNDTSINLLADYITSNLNTNYVYSMIDAYNSTLIALNNLNNTFSNVITDYTSWNAKIPTAGATYDIPYFSYYPLTNFAWYLQDSDVNTTNENIQGTTSYNGTSTTTITRYWTYLAYVNGSFTLAPNMDSVNDAILSCLISYMKANNSNLLNSTTRMNAYDLSALSIIDSTINVNNGDLSFKIAYNNQVSNTISFALTPQWNTYWGNTNISYLPFYHYYYNKYGTSISNINLTNLSAFQDMDIVFISIAIPQTILKQ